jgi:excinuclease ABC subunit C
MSTETTKIEKILAALPAQPGIYKMKNAEGKIIYIGKAKSLRNRVKSYFQRTADLDDRKQSMVSQISDIEYIEVGTELEALMLETNLIKQFRPKYNILMKDDKGYVYIRVSVDEDFPRITIVRRVEKDKAKYFGPKTAQYKVKQTLDILRKILPFRHCGLGIRYVGPNGTEHDVEVTNKVLKYPCLYHYIRRCAAPCIGKIDPMSYRGIINKVINFLEGKPDELMNQLKDEMNMFATQKKFEKAAAIRDKLKVMEEMFEKQRISDPSRKDTDVFHFITDNSRIYTNLFQIREGRIVGQENFILNNSGEKDLPSSSDICEAFIRDYYQSATNIPDEILVPELLDEDEKEMTEAWLSAKRGKKVHILWPQIGEKNKLLELSLANARSYAHQQKVKWLREEVVPKESLEDLAKTLNLPKPPKRIECYDISHFGGTGTVASMVVLQNGAPANAEYRRFKLRTIPHGKPDDYASMREVLTRRLKYLTSSNYRFQEPSKKLFEEMKKSLIEQEIPETFTQKNLLIMLEEKTNIGYINFTLPTNDTGEILSIHIDDAHRGQKHGHQLIAKLLEKHKGVKKWYVKVPPERTEYYEQFGFNQLKDTPETYMIETHKALENYKKFAVKPDLLVLDGGKGQLGIGVEVLETLKLSIPICSLAKQEEEIFLPRNSVSIKLPKESHTLHLMQRIRDESHRFAVTYSNLVHNKSLITSELDGLPGIGELTKKKLLKHFGSLSSIKNATMDELARVAGKKSAIALKQQFQGK